MPGKITLFLTFILAYFLSPICIGQDSTDISLQREGEVTVRIPEKEVIDSYLENNDYQYGSEYKPAAREGLFQRLWRKLLYLVALAFEATRYLPVIVRIIIIASLLVIGYIIATRTKLYRLFYADPVMPHMEFAEIDPGDARFDFNKAIETELSQNNFRNAIRLLHLKILKDLELKEIIQFSKDKTNREYTYEIKDSSLKNEFIRLTGIYNRVWYGKYPLAKSEFHTLAAGFHHFTNELYAGKE